MVKILSLVITLAVLLVVPAGALPAPEPADAPKPLPVVTGPAAWAALAKLWPAPQPANGVAGNDAGCDTPPGFSGAYVVGVGSGPCPGGFPHGWGVTHTYVRCEGACFTHMNAFGTNPGGAFADCTSGSEAVISWDPGLVIVLDGFCNGWAWGANPTAWNLWDGWCNAGMGSTLCVSADNPADVLLHVLG